MHQLLFNTHSPMARGAAGQGGQGGQGRAGPVGQSHAAAGPGPGAETSKVVGAVNGQ
jgi:hypothetical protein